MSGFDFDALRDPVAPQPGALERADVDARARQMKGRARRTRLAAGATSLVAIVVIAVVAVLATRTTEPAITVEGGASTTLPPTTTPTTTPTTYGRSTPAGGYVPRTTLENGLVVLPVTLPDGETFTMKYPPAMKIAQLGFLGGINVAGKQVQIRYTTIQHTYADSDRPVHVYPGANGSQVMLFHANQRLGYVGPNVDELAYQFGKWLAFVEAPSSATDQATWARNLSGADSDGYLVLESDSLPIGNAFDGGFGSVPGNSIELASHLYCKQPGSDTSAHRRLTNGDGTKGVSWCDGDLHVSAGGTDSFVNLTDTSLHISPLAPSPGTSPAQPPPTTTTTTTPNAPSSPAVSASWVSPNNGWVLEQSGSVAQTTDGGTTWHTVGSLGKGYWDNARIRFISASDGFAFGIGTSPLMITHDAGATWINLDTPFASTYDLSISNGMVYVVGMPPTPNGFFGIWSTPVEHLVWKRDPRSLEIGGGPAPTDEVVLSGTSGWIVNVNRTVISGARLSANKWVAWNPPCLGKNGPAYLAASTPTDLVATCNEGVWGPPKQATTVYVSHDGGITFTRSVAPGFGPVAAANPTTAIIGGNGTLWRTTNGGTSWSVVAKFSDPNVIPSDIGFTTTTQGFVIAQNNEFLMTHDAGATWKKVTLP